MALKPVLQSLDGLSDDLKKQYVQKGDEFQLNVEGGLVSREKLEEFRDNNIELKKKNESLEEKYKGIDPAEARELLKISQSLKETKLIDAGKIDEVVEERTKAMKADYEGKLSALTEKDVKQSRQLESLLIDTAIQAEAVKAGVLDKAMDDVLLRGHAEWKVVEGKAVRMRGDKIVYGKDGTTPESMSEYIAGLSSSAPHLFKPSTGGGANGSGGANGAKTMTRAAWDALDPATKMAKAKEHVAVVD